MATLREYASLRRHRLAIIGILVMFDALWSLKRSLTLTDNIAATVSSYFQNSIERRRTTTASSTTSITSNKETSSNSGRSGSIKIDIISIGSIHRPEYQNGQQETFGSHEAVRNFFRFNEWNDSSFEPQCHTNLTMEQVKKISKFCHRKGPNNAIWRMRHKFASFRWLGKKANAPGWVCAQKRLPFSLSRMLRSYHQHEQQQQTTRQHQVLSTLTASNITTTTFIRIPDYLVVMDDDTYLNMPSVIQTLPREYPAWDADAAHVVAGCLVQERIKEVNFTFPFGGWSTIFSARAIQNFIRPIHCNNRNSSDDDVTFDAMHHDSDERAQQAQHKEFVAAACRRLSENLIGEQVLFKDGMSVAHLMDAYVTRHPYLDIDTWDGVGYCLHSDWVVGFFVNFYNIASRHAQYYNPEFPHHLIQGYLGSTMYAGKKTDEVKAQYKECNHDSNEKCTSLAHICHYVTPDRMRTLYQMTAAS